MSEEIDDGGPAFPTNGYPGEYTYRGISMRDYFAGQALIGLTAGRVVLIGHGDATGEGDLTIDGEAEDAYRYADAMIAARNP